MNTGKTNIRNFCDETEELIDDYLEGVISSKDKEIMESHLSTCEYCRKYLDETSKLKLQLGTLSGNYEYLSSAEKEDLWKEVESKVDFAGRAQESAASNALMQSSRKDSVFYRYRYLFSGMVAVLLVGVIYFAAKNLKFGGVSLTQQDVFGMPTYWKVSSIVGTPYISSEAMAKLDSIRDGQYIITNDSSRAELLIADVGKVIVEPNTKLMIVKGEDGKNRLSVVYGTIDADMKKVSEPVPVELPSAIATDQEGSFKLTVDNSGDGLFFVKTGRVEVSSGTKQSVVPAGALVMTKKNKGVGTPFSINSSSLFKKALFDFDFGNCDATCVSTIMNSATSADAVTLVNMIPRVNENMKAKVYDRAIAITPAPPNVPRDSIPFIDEAEIEEWVEKIQVEVNENIEKSMKNLEKSLEHLKVLETISIDTLKWADDMEKNFKIKVKTHPGDYNFEFMPDSVRVFFDKEEFKQEMEELKRELAEDEKERKEELRAGTEELKRELEEAEKERKLELKIDLKELNEDLKELQEELKDENIQRNEDLKRELERARKEIEKAMKEVNEKVKIEVNSEDDGKIEVKVKTEEPDTPKPPETK
jgi:hypothetical protein